MTCARDFRSIRGSSCRSSSALISSVLVDGRFFPAGRLSLPGGAWSCLDTPIPCFGLNRLTQMITNYSPNVTHADHVTISGRSTTGRDKGGIYGKAVANSFPCRPIAKAGSNIALLRHDDNLVTRCYSCKNELIVRAQDHRFGLEIGYQ